MSTEPTPGEHMDAYIAAHDLETMAERITAQEDIIRELREVLRTVRESYSVQGSKSLLELVDHALNSSDAPDG